MLFKAFYERSLSKFKGVLSKVDLVNLEKLTVNQNLVLYEDHVNNLYHRFLKLLDYSFRAIYTRTVSDIIIEFVEHYDEKEENS